MAYVFFVTINLVDLVRSSGECTFECELQWKPFQDLGLSGPQRDIEFVVFVSYEHMIRVQAVRRIANKRPSIYINAKSVDCLISYRIIDWHFHL